MQSLDFFFLNLRTNWSLFKSVRYSLRNLSLRYPVFSAETLILLQYFLYLFSQQIPPGIAISIFIDSRSSCIASWTFLSIPNITPAHQKSYLSILAPWATFLHFRFQWIPSHIDIPPSEPVNQFAKEAALIGTSCPTFLAQDLIPHPINIIKSNWTLHYISHPSAAHYSSIQSLPSVPSMVP